MKRWIRWKGLIAFTATVIAIVLVWVLVVDSVVRRGIEIVGTRIVGARVDLAKADLSLFPTGLELTGLAVTNPEAPMQNAVEIGRMKMDLDPGYLIRRKVIIGDLLMEGLRFDTPRERSGEVAAPADRRAAEKKETDVAGVSKAAVEKVCGKFTLPSLSRPDVQAILDREPLTSIQLATDLEKKIDAEKARWEKELTRLADEKTLEAYRKRIEKLKHTGSSLGALLGAAGDAQALQADIRKDLNLLKEAQTTFTKDLQQYRRQVDALTEAPLKDIRRIMEKYGLSAAGLSNLSRLIFGERLCGWMGTAVKWYRKVQPYLSKIPKGGKNTPEEHKPLRGKGIDIRFAETPPMPDFLIRRLKADAQLSAGHLTGKAENITLDQPILGRPLTFAFIGKGMKRIASLSLIGTADYVTPGTPKNEARLTIRGLGLADLPLIREKSLPLTLKKADSDLNLNLDTTGDVLDAALKADFSAVKITSQAATPSDAIAKALTTAISGVDRFSLKADVTGTLEAYTLDVKSDLDKTLKSAVGNLVKAESAELQSALKSRIEDKLKGPMAQTKGSLAGLDAIGAELAKRLNLGDDLLKGLKLKF